MIAQHGITHDALGVPPIRYDALEDCLTNVKHTIDHLGKSSVHMPRIGCGLAGGKWGTIEPIIERTLLDIETYVYDFDTGDSRTIPWTA
jgi:O-acetyl-ADP-ribose deacetylase (regulator of RNase III)